MKRLISIVLAFSTLTSFAQTSVDGFFAKVGESRVSFDYTFLVNAQTKIKGSGDVTVQDDAFRMNGNGLEVWCDGSVRWTIDRDGEEAVVESVEENGAARYSANPALLLTNLDKAFVRTKSATDTFQGKKAWAVYMKPQVSCDVSMVKLYFVSSVLEGASVTVADGTQTDFVFSGWKFEEKTESLSAFRFDESTLGKDYWMTDLR